MLVLSHDSQLLLPLPVTSTRSFLRQRVQELQQADLLSTAEVPVPVATADKMRGLAYLDAVAHETLRCWPPLLAGAQPDSSCHSSMIAATKCTVKHVCCRRASSCAATLWLPWNRSMRSGFRLCCCNAGVGRELAQDANVHGTIIPAGTIVGLSIWTIHYNKEAWGEDAGVWQPERWLRARSINACKRDASGNLRWLPFVHGAQSCLGQHIALV